VADCLASNVVTWRCSELANWWIYVSAVRRHHGSFRWNEQHAWDRCFNFGIGCSLRRGIKPVHSAVDAHGGRHRKLVSLQHKRACNSPSDSSDALQPRIRKLSCSWRTAERFRKTYPERRQGGNLFVSLCCYVVLRLPANWCVSKISSWLSGITAEALLLETLDIFYISCVQIGNAVISSSLTLSWLASVVPVTD